jgi:hypothetical protein
MQIKPEKEHHWLRKFVGEWTFEAEAVMAPGQPPARFTGTETGRLVGDVWMIAEGQSDTPDGCAGATLLTLGYDPARKRFVGTWIGSMMTHLWVYDGALDAAGRVLTLDTEGPNPAAEGKLGRFQDVIEFKSDDHRVLTSALLGEDGTWRRFMTANYRRKK